MTANTALSALLRTGWRRSLVLLVLLALIGSACGSPPAPTPRPTDPEPTQSPAAEPPATATEIVAATLVATSIPVEASTTVETSTTVEAATKPPATPTPEPTAPPQEPTATESPTASPAPTDPPPTETPPPPTDTPLPTDTPPPPSPTPLPTPTGPQVLSFRVAPEVTNNVGDRLTFDWQAVGERAELCPISGQGPVELRCREVPLAGSTEFVTDEESMAYTGFGLRVTAGDSFAWGTANVRLQCQNLRPWFFDDPPQRCPADLADESYAAGQYFERGLMIWVEEADDFYVFYRGKDEQGFQTFDWITYIQLKPGASPDNRVGEEPPPGLVEPISGFGMVWRGEIEGVRDDVRQRLGWATGPEAGFDTAYQCVTPSHPRSWSCFLRGPQGETLSLHPDSTAQVRLLWEEW